ncbi:MAG: hypothetical protein M3R25_07915, partial [Bacteroidota bacterium]|nr:hypothetical protein [Bacteroidota bacterium]
MSRKLVVTLVLILFLLPFVSWYYLQSGLTWRKEAQAIMNGTTPFPIGQWKDQTAKAFSNKFLEQHVTLAVNMSCTNQAANTEVLEKIYDQFKDTKKTNYILLMNCENAGASLLDSTRMNWFVFNCQDSL